MNKKIENPLIIYFTEAEKIPLIKRDSSGTLLIPVNIPYQEFSSNVFPVIKEHDSILVHVSDNVDRDRKGTVNNISVKLNGLIGIGNKETKTVLTYESMDKPMYWMNPSFTDKKEAAQYAPKDNIILDKYESFGSDEAWQEHQGRIWSRMADMMPLSRRTDKFNHNHAAKLLDPKRGLEEKDLPKFWSFKSNVPISPTVMGDDMVGMPSIDARSYEGFVRVKTEQDGTVTEEPVEVLSLQTYGTQGIAIPMANANGHVSKHQIAADMNSYNTELRFRAGDGRSVEKKGLFDKKTRQYAFTFQDGTQTGLKVLHVDMNENIDMEDSHGTFSVRPNQEMIDTLKYRGYSIPDPITSIKPETKGKYIWQSPGSMTGSKDVLKTVSPSNPGFIIASEPKNGMDDYVVLVAEGALKGHIVAKYINVKDENGVCFGDQIAGDRGIIVAQVPGVAKAFVENVAYIYGKYSVHGTYIAMDADGRENRNVALGINSAYECLNKKNPTNVLCWNPSQKGLDDALLAVAQGTITIKDMDLITGTAEELFPVDAAAKMVAHKLSNIDRKILDKVDKWAAENLEMDSIDTPSGIDRKILDKVDKWTAENLEMDSIDTPSGYKSSYLYQQAVIRKETAVLKLPVKPVYQHRGDWGVLNMEATHPIEENEKREIRSILKNSGMVLIGDMKLTQQTVTKDNSISPQKNNAVQLAI